MEGMEIRNCIEKALKECGVPMGDAFFYLQDALEYMMKAEYLRYGGIKELMEQVGKKHNTKWNTVYKKIKNAISYVFFNTDTEGIYKIFGNGVSRCTGEVGTQMFLNGMRIYIQKQLEGEKNGNGTAGI